MGGGQHCTAGDSDADSHPAGRGTCITWSLRHVHYLPLPGPCLGSALAGYLGPVEKSPPRGRPSSSLRRSRAPAPAISTYCSTTGRLQLFYIVQVQLDALCLCCWLLLLTAAASAICYLWSMASGSSRIYYL
jgi:hypothetical protein